MWASLNPQELLPHPEPIDGKRWETISSLTGFLRNVLIFLPVLLTWLSIGRAIAAFGNYAEDYQKQFKTDSTIQFLQFWQDPGKYLSDFWRIQNVAVFDAVLIALIIILTFVSGTLSVRAESAGSKAQKNIENRRLAIGLQISNSLHGKRQANPESIGEALAEALNDLTQAARDVNESASRLESVSVGVAALNPHIEALNQSTNTFVSSTGAQISDSVKELVSSVQNLNSAVGGNVTSLFADAALTIEEVSKQLARTNASVEYGTKQLRDDLDAIHQQLQSITRGGR
jgi:archaellum component FlaC